MCRTWAVFALSTWMIATEAAPATAVDKPRFSRHVTPLFSRLGCNAGACHGAVQGQNGSYPFTEAGTTWQLTEATRSPPTAFT